MRQDSRAWAWPIDRAAEQSRSPLLTGSTLALYTSGALILISQPALALSKSWAQAGDCLLALGVAGSLAILAKVVITRTRLTLTN